MRLTQYHCHRMSPTRLIRQCSGLVFFIHKNRYSKKIIREYSTGEGSSGNQKESSRLYNRWGELYIVLLKIILIVGANPGKETIITNEAILTRLHALLTCFRMEIARERAASLPGGETIHVAIHCSGASRNTALPRIRATFPELKPEPYINCRVT